MRPLIVSAIVGKELREAARNRTLLLVVVLPLVASLAFAWLQGESRSPLQVGVPAGDAELFARVLPDRIVQVRPYSGEGSRALFNEHPDWDALIAGPSPLDRPLRDGSPVELTIFINGKRGPAAQMAAAQLPLLLQTLGSGPPRVTVTVEGNGTYGAVDALLSVWMTVTTVMLGIMIMSGNIAEERDKGTWLALLTTRTRLSELVAGKALYGTLLIVSMCAVMLAAHRIPFRSALEAVAVLIPGALCFTLLGLFLGFLARNQATARSYGTLLYLPLLIPVFAVDASPLVARWAFLFPSYHLWAGLEGALSSAEGGAAGGQHALWLAGFSVAAAVLMTVAVSRRRS